MNITKIEIYIASADNDRLLAYASIILDDVFIVRDLKIIKGPNGLFVAMPSKKRRDGEGYKDIAHPLNQETRKKIETLILDEYYKKESNSDKVLEEESIRQ